MYLRICIVCWVLSHQPGSWVCQNKGPKLSTWSLWHARKTLGTVVFGHGPLALVYLLRGQDNALVTGLTTSLAMGDILHFSNDMAHNLPFLTLRIVKELGPGEVLVGVVGFLVLFVSLFVFILPESDNFPKCIGSCSLEWISGHLAYYGRCWYWWYTGSSSSCGKPKRMPWNTRHTNPTPTPCALKQLGHANSMSHSWLYINPAS